MPHTLYQQTIEYLFSRLPLFSRVGAIAYKKDLTNTIQLCSFLNNPQKQFKSIHVAGTNGKGSVSHMLAAVLQQAGYKTGLYTSPHLKDFRERIRINGEMIPQDFVIRFTEKMKPLIAEIEPSFFELTVAMAFEYFAREEVDIAVVEVGLGGRLDSTNVILPELSVITNISYDHMNILGNTLEKIAGEKAGIIKSGVPVIIGETHEQTRPVFERAAAEKKAPILFADECYTVDHTVLTIDKLEVQLRNRQNDTFTVNADLNGLYQEKNIATVFATVAQLRQRQFTITDADLQQALGRVKQLNGLHGRWEVVHHQPFIVLDVAHNEAGLSMITRQLELLRSHFTQLHIVLGMVKDKDVNKALAVLPGGARYYFTQAQVPRALEATSLKRKARPFHLSGAAYANVQEALQAALAQAAPDDLVLVCGSVFLVGEVDTRRLTA